MGLFVQNGYWWMSYTPKGLSRVRVSTGISAGLDGSKTYQKDQRGKAQSLYDDAQGGLLAIKIARATGELPEPPAPVEMFADWCAYYDENYISKHRGKDREREIVETLKPFLWDKRLDQIDLDLYREIETARAVKVCANTVNRELDLLKSILKRAAEHKKIPMSPIAGASKLTIVKRAKIRMSVEHEARILAAITNPRDKAAIIMGLTTLARMGDILDFRYEHDHGKTITIVDPKNGELLEVPCSKRLRAALDAIQWGHVSGYYFWHRRQAKNPRDWTGSLRQMFRRACKRAGVRYGRNVGGLTWHRATRATGASRMLDAKVNMVAVQKIGGWKSLKSVEGYITPNDATLIEAVETVSAGYYDDDDDNGSAPAGAKVPPQTH